MFNLLDCEVVMGLRGWSWDSGAIFDIRIAKSFRLIFASLHCMYLAAAPIPLVQDAILSLPNPYLRGTAVPLDTVDVLTLLE